MGTADITTDAVRHALRAIRSARSLDESPLMYLDVVTERLREERIPSNQDARAAFLPRWIEEVVLREISRHRGEEPAKDARAPEAEDPLAALKADFRSSNTDRKAWALLRFRVFSGSAATLRQLSDELEIGYNTVRRRFDRGCQLLANTLRNLETAVNVAVAHGQDVPEELTPFIGREAELAEVRRMLAEHRLVTLTGIGGIGKSRLALHLVRSLAPIFPDGAWFVDLTVLEDGQHVLGAVMSTLRLSDQPGRSGQDVLFSHVADKQMLLAMDNCESMVAQCSDLIEALLSQCPSVQVLATSREQLTVRGQASFVVPPLALPVESEPPQIGAVVHSDAVRLFGSRARAAAPSFRVDAGNAYQVSRICRQLDGIPLAIEMAAARLRFLALDQIETRLQDRFSILRSDRSASRPGHETMRLVLADSYELLPEPARALLQRLSVFRSGWTLEAAEAVCSDTAIPESKVLDLLARLEATSFIIVRHDTNPPRSGMLETVRQFAFGLMEAEDKGEGSVWRDRHLEYFQQLVTHAGDKFNSPDQDEGIKQLRSEYANIISALHWARRSGNAGSAMSIVQALRWHWMTTATFSEGRIETQRVLDMPAAAGEIAGRGKLLLNLGAFEWRLGNLESALRLWEGCEATFREIGDEHGTASVLHNMAVIAFQRANLEQARRWFEKSLNLHRKIGHGVGTAKVLNSLGLLEKGSGNYDQARKYLEEALQVHREIGNTGGLANALSNLGALASDCDGDQGAAKRLFEEALAISEDTGQAYGQMHCLTNLSVVAHRMNCLVEATAFSNRCLTLAREADAREMIAQATLHLGAIARAQGNLGRAKHLCRESITITRDLGRVDLQMKALEELAALAATAGKARRAIRLAAAADIQRAQHHLPREPMSIQALEDAMEQAFDGLSESEADQASAEGRTLPLANAMSYALDELGWDELADKANSMDQD